MPETAILCMSRQGIQRDFNELLQIIQKNFKKIKKVLDFFVIIGYNNFCAVEETVQDKKNHIYARLAQLEEHLTLNQGVQGSSPWRRTESTVFDDCEHRGRCFFCLFLIT